jgi:hypothetical protein
VRAPPPTPPAHLRGLLQDFDRERRTLFLAGIVGECLPHLTRLHGLAGDWHQISFSELSAENADEVIAEQVEHYGRLGVAVEWAAYAHDAPVDLVARLERAGFAIGPREAVVVLDCAVPPGWLGEPCPHPVERVRTPEQLSVFAAVAERIFGTDQTPVVRELKARLAESSAEHIAYVAYAQGTVASVARLYTHPASQFAGLYGGGTLAGQRGRGLYRALVRQRALDALASGARYLRVDALPTSQPILERLGFEVMTYVWPCVFEP